MREGEKENGSLVVLTRCINNVAKNDERILVFCLQFVVKNGHSILAVN